MNRRRWFWCVVAVVAGVVSALSKESLRIVPIVKGNEVLVSFELADAYTGDVRAAIASGLRTTFAYDVDLRMMAPMWVDRTIATVLVSTTDQYDNLTRRHSLSRMVDDLYAAAAVSDLQARVGTRLLPPHQRSVAAARRLAARLGDRDHRPGAVHLRAIGPVARRRPEILLSRVHQDH